MSMPCSSRRSLIVGKRERRKSSPRCRASSQHVVGPGLRHPPDDRVRDDVPGRELGHRVHVGHEPHAVGVQQQRTLAAHRLGHQGQLPLHARAEPEHRRVELHELDVAQHRPGAQGRGDPVAGRLRGVGGRAVHLADAAGRQHDRAAQGGADAVALPLADHVQRHAARAPGPAVRSGRTREHVEDERVLDDLDARVVAHGLDLRDERAGDLRPRRVAARVRDAVGVVPALARQRDAAVGGRVEHAHRARRARARAAGPR